MNAQDANYYECSQHYSNDGRSGVDVKCKICIQVVNLWHGQANAASCLCV